MFRKHFAGSKRNVPSINPREAWERLSDARSLSVLIDVREPWEYKSGHAQKARNIPLSQLQQRVQEVPRDREVLLICQSGSRSLQAAEFLQQHDIPQVVNVTGGTTVWRMHRLPIEQG